MRNPLVPFLENDGCVVLDGALATELERRGENLRDPLWSAKVLLDNPELILAVHLDYFRAGANVAITASYQATFAGFAARGLEPGAAGDLMLRSVELAQRARDAFCFEAPHRTGPKPVVAASIGPYGAFLANGAEYTGDYGIGAEELWEFHRERLALMASSGVDLLACETIPSLQEAEVLVQLLAELDMPVPAWLSFSCRDGEHLAHGEPFAEAVALANASPHVVAVGVNCTAPRFVEPLLLGVRGVCAKPLLAYPNSGEGWDAVRGCWVAGEPTDFAALASRWRAAGARGIGGCCRTTPEDIRAIAAACHTNVG